MQQFRISNGTLRILSGLLIALICLVCAFANTSAQVVFLASVLLLCAYEWAGFYPNGQKPKGVLTASIILLGGLVGFSVNSHYFLWAIVAGGFLMIADLVRFPTKQHRFGLTLCQAFIYPGLSLGAFAQFLAGENFVIPILLFYFIVVWSSDVGAYYIGRKLGKLKLAKHVSPNKTIEGFLGGGLTSILAAAIWYLILGQKTLIFYILLSLTIWVFCSMGDLVQSKIKRMFRIKDSSNLIPGHGGFFDRFDGFIFAAPFFILAYSILY